MIYSKVNSLSHLHVGIDQEYYENDWLASVDDLSATTEMKNSIIASHSRSSISGHADLRCLLDIALGEKSEDITIRFSAVKQLTSTIVKDSNLLVTMDISLCADMVTKLNDIISENFLTFLCDNESDDEKERFVTHCLMLLRCVLLAVPVLLDDIHLDILTPLCESQEGVEGKGGTYAPYVLHFVLLSHMVGWGSGEVHTPLTIFSLCCQDILRLWALRPIDCKHNVLRHKYLASPSSLARDDTTVSSCCSHADVTLPACYASDFYACNLSTVPADVIEKFFRPLVFEFSACSMLSSNNCWKNDLESSSLCHISCDDTDEGSAVITDR